MLLACIVHVGAMADDLMVLKIENVDNVTFNKLISQVGRIAFEKNGDVKIVYLDKTIKPEVIGNRKTESDWKIVFGDNSISTDLEPDATIVVSVYPNPAADHVHVEGLKDGQLVHIFTLTGEKVLVAPGPDVNVTKLRNGIYLLQAGRQVVKLIKK